VSLAPAENITLAHAALFAVALPFLIIHQHVRPLYKKRFSDHRAALFPFTSPSGLFPRFMLKNRMKIPNDLKYDEKGLIPAVIQDWKTGEVLMVAYMNAGSVKKTVETGLTWFWSRSRQKFWQKGETSGNVQKVKDILYDCDQDTLLVKVEQRGPACHTGERSCFFRRFE